MRSLARGVSWALIAAILTLLLAIAAPRLVGGQSYVVVSNSMADSVETGDLILVLPRRADEIEVGEIVAFTDPEESGRSLQHRVQRVSRVGSQIEVVTMGDANSGYERWRVPADASVGHVATVISRAGYVFGPIGKPIVRGVFNAVGWFCLLGLALGVIWRRSNLRGLAVVAALLAAAAGLGAIEGHLATQVVNANNEFSAAVDFDQEGGG